MADNEMYCVYFAKSLKNSKIYVGFSSKDPAIRIGEHNRGINSWTKNNGPFKLMYYEKYFCKEDAKSRELFYKSGIGKQIKKEIVRVMESIPLLGPKDQ